MKKLSILSFLILMLMSMQNYGQPINVNPDPNGDPWWVGDCLLPSPEEMALVTEFVTSPEALAVTLPTKVYNDELMFFPPIFMQQGASCVQAAEVGYNFTYEINRLRGVPAGNWHDIKTNCYHHLFTYNFLNDADGLTATDIYSGFNIIKENGCPSYDIYYDPAMEGPEEYKYWMTGYDNYFSGMHNRISSNHTFVTNTPNPSSLDNIKHRLYNHSTTGNGPGGLVIIDVNANGWDINQLIPPDSPEEPGKKLISHWGTGYNGAHLLTIVGYNDGICCFDLNNDGEYTNNEDVNGDSIIDLLDYEKGAFKVANSHDVGFGDGGFIFVPYRLMAAGLEWDYAYFCNVEEEYEPLLMIKTSIEYNRRRQLYFTIGMAQFANQTQPQFSRIPVTFLNRGGCLNMRGVSTYEGPIELGLDFGYWFLDADFGKIFFTIFESEQDCAPGEGTINNFSIIDKRWGETFELSDPTTVPIVQNGQTIRSIEYDLMPHHEELIDQDLTLSSNMVSRFKPTVTNGATLTVESGVKIDMYNSEIVINQGSSVVLGNDVTIRAKKGICKIIIDGNITIGTNVSFYGEGENQIILQINNQLVNLGISSCHFNNVALITYNDQTTISNSTTFDGSAIFGFNGSYSISDCDFNSSITRFVGDGLSRVVDPMIGITNGCQFNNAISNAIEIDNYPNFRIQNCTISGSYNGIMLSNSGFGKGDQLVIGNVITGNTNTAITAYRSYVDVFNNTIENNNVGIISFNRSVMHIEGDSRNVSQIIKDNGSYELLASEDSFPQYLHWNLIQDDDNLPGDPLVKYTGTNYSLDVVNNCWGLSFNPNDDLSPAGHYSWSPVWNCSLGHGTAYNSITESLYLDAINKIDSGDYANAKSEFREIVLTDPTSEYAKAALKEMLSLEEYDENNYQDLKSYYATDSSILNTPELTKLSDFLINFCEIKIENWPTAIDWFENEIINPESFEDSIFAIIDLGYTYFLMENNGLKSSYSGKLTEYVPTSRGQFEIKRDYLLSLLPGDQLHKSQNEGLNSFAEGELLQNIPNPFSGTTQIYYTIDFESDIQLNIYDNLGQLVITISQGNQPKGKHFVEFDSTGLPGGVYFYSLVVNGIPDSSRKMMVLH